MSIKSGPHLHQKSALNKVLFWCTKHNLNLSHFIRLCRKLVQRRFYEALKGLVLIYTNVLLGMTLDSMLDFFKSIVPSLLERIESSSPGVLQTRGLFYDI